MDSDYTTGSPRSSRRLKRMVLLFAAAFLIGLGLMAWAVMRWAPARDLVVGQPQSVPATASRRALPPPLVAPTVGVADQGMSARIAALEDRIAKLGGVSENGATSARAEGLLIAFAARRAIDRGLSLGYLEGALQQQFGATQPRAVGIIIAAAQQPVTTDKLKTDLDALGPRLLRASPDKGWLESAREAMGSLIIVRKAGSVSTAPAERLARAGRMVEAGRVDVALTEVARLPGAANGAEWMRDARRLVEAHRALDLLEASAIMQPGTAATPPPLPPATPAPLAPVPSNAAAPAGRAELL